MSMNYKEMWDDIKKEKMSMSDREKLETEWISCHTGFNLCQVEEYGKVKLTDKMWEFLHEDIKEVLEDHFIDIKRDVISNYFSDKMYEVYKDNGPIWTEYELDKL